MSANEGDWISAKFHLMNTFNLHAKRGFGLYSHNLLSYDWDYVNVVAVVVVVGHVPRLQRLRPEIDTKRCVFNELTKKEKKSLLASQGKKKNRERKSGRKRKGKGVRSPVARGGCDVRQRGAIIVSGFHRAMITLTAEMAHNKRTFGYTKVRCRREGFWGEWGRRKKPKTETETQKQKQEEKKWLQTNLSAISAA